MDYTIGQLRDLLHRPSAQNWTTLCTLLEAWPDTAQLERDILHYTLGHLEAWDDSLRVAPPRWHRALLCTAHHRSDISRRRLVALMCIATYLELPWARDHLYVTAVRRKRVAWPVPPYPVQLRSFHYRGRRIKEGLLPWLASLPAPQLRSFYLALGQAPGNEELARLGEASWWPHLEHVGLRGLATPEILEFLEAHAWNELGALTLSEVPLTAAQLERILRLDGASALSELYLAGCELDASHLEVLRDWQGLAGLELLDLTHNPGLGHAALDDFVYHSPLGPDARAYIEGRFEDIMEA